MSTENIREQKVKALFKHNPKINKFYMCADNQAFTNKDKAQSHAQTLKDQEVDTYKRKEKEAPLDPILEGNIGDLTSALKNIDDLEKLDGLKLQESTGKNRAGALNAIDERISELNGDD